MTHEQASAYYSQAYLAEIEEMVARHEHIKDNTAAENYDAHLEFIQYIAQCNKIQLSQQTIKGDFAFLSYKTTNTCNEPRSDEEKIEVKMHNEKGWKIQKIILYLNLFSK